MPMVPHYQKKNICSICPEHEFLLLPPNAEQTLAVLRLHSAEVTLGNALGQELRDVPDF